MAGEELKVILSIPLAWQGRDDELIWAKTKNEAYSVRCGYFVARAMCREKWSEGPTSSFTPQSSLWKLIWSMWRIPKVNTFCGELIVEPCQLKIHYLNLCLVGGKEVETIKHTLLFSEKAKLSWFSCPLSIRIDEISIRR